MASSVWQMSPGQLRRQAIGSWGDRHQADPLRERGWQVWIQVHGTHTLPGLTGDGSHRRRQVQQCAREHTDTVQGVSLIQVTSQQRFQEEQEEFREE